MQLLQRNYRVRKGEIDLIMQDGDTIVFVEVRFRGAGSRGSGAESVTRAKQNRIISAAEHFLLERHSNQFRPCRFDVVSIGSDSGQAVMSWIRGAFGAG